MVKVRFLPSVNVFVFVYSQSPFSLLIVNAMYANQFESIMNAGMKSGKCWWLTDEYGDVVEPSNCGSRLI